MLPGFETLTTPICRDEMDGIEKSVLEIQKTAPLATRLVVERLYAVAYNAQNDIDFMTREISSYRKQTAQLVWAYQDARTARREAERERDAAQAETVRVSQALTRAVNETLFFKSEAETAHIEAAQWKQRAETLTKILHAQGLTVREHDHGSERWLTILPAGCKCEREIGDAPCPLHTLGVGDAD